MAFWGVHAFRHQPRNMKKFFALYVSILIASLIIINNISKRNNYRLVSVSSRYFLSRNDINRLKRVDRGPPIVIQKHKLVFFWNQKSACSYWKRIFQFIEGVPKEKMWSLHTPERSGLTYLDNFTDPNIMSMMHDKAWVKATFVREPRERILSAYLDKAVDNNFVYKECNRSVASFSEFVELIKICYNPHWESQVRVPVHFYKDMLIGYMDNIKPFTVKLLKRIGAWNDTVSKWLDNQSNNDLARTKMHATSATKRIQKFYNPDLEKQILTLFSEDYKVFGFDTKLFTSFNSTG